MVGFLGDRDGFKGLSSLSFQRGHRGRGDYEEEEKTDGKGLGTDVVERNEGMTDELERASRLKPIVITWAGNGSRRSEDLSFLSSYHE